MITLTNDEMLTLLDELTAQELRVYMYLASTYTEEWTEHSIRKLAKVLKAGKTTIQRTLKSLKEKKYIETKEAESFTAVRLKRGCTQNGTQEQVICTQNGTQEQVICTQNGTPNVPIRNIKRERVYIIFLLNIIFLFLNKNNFSSLSDIPYRVQKGVPEMGHPVPEMGHPEQKYSFSEQFYQQIEELGIRVNAELKRRLDLLGAEKVTDLYYQVTWDNSIRKPGTIFLKEIMKAYEKKKKEKDERQKEASNYRTWAGSRELSMRDIYLSYKNLSKEKLIKSWRNKSKFFGYTEEEMDLFEEQVINEEIKEKLEKEKEN